MIRKFKEEDIDRVAEIWLTGNLQAHSFVDKKYWTDNFPKVKEMFMQAEIYVCQSDKTGVIQGFVGLMENYVAGIFVSAEYRSSGTGKELLDFVKNTRDRLTLNVFAENRRAVKFYEREGFSILNEGTDGDTGEREYTMTWKRVIK